LLDWELGRRQKGWIKTLLCSRNDLF